MKSLSENWLAIELGAVSQELEGWSVGLRDSFNSLFDDDAADEANTETIRCVESTETHPLRV